MRNLITIVILGLALLSPPTAWTQTQDIAEDTIRFEELPRTPIKAIQSILNQVIETKDLQKEQSLKTAFDILQKWLDSKGKKVRLEIDVEAFKEEDIELDVLTSPVRLQPYPKKMQLSTCLRVLAAQINIPCGTFWLSRGKILLTTIDNAQQLKSDAQVSGDFEDTPLARLLEDLSDQTGVAIIVDRRYRRLAQMPVSIRLGGVRLRTAMRLLTDMCELAAVPAGSCYYVTSPTNARTFARLQARRERDETAATRPNGKSYPRADSLWVGIVNIPMRGRFNKRSLNRILAEATADAFVFDRRIYEQAEQPLTAWFPNESSVGTALSMLTDMLDLAWVPMEDAVYITSRDNARRLERELRNDVKPSKSKSRQSRNSAALLTYAAQPKDPEPLPQSIRDAWEKAGFTSGWMRDAYGFFLLTGLPTDERFPEAVLPAFEVKQWKAGAVKPLPIPKRPFGLDFYNFEATDGVLKEAADFKKLSWLLLDGTKLTATGLKQLTSLPELEMLTIFRGKVTAEGLKHLSTIKSLRKLALACETDETHLGHLRNVRSLVPGEVTPVGLKILATLDNLEALSISDVTDEGLRQLTKTKSLRKLYLGHSKKVTDDGIKHVSRISSLRWLGVGEMTDSGLKHLSAFKNLQYLDIANTEVTDEGVAALQKALPKLKINRISRRRPIEGAAS